MTKIMIVDDEESVLKLVKKILEKKGYNVITASSGEECLAKVERDRPDLILLDVMMPEMDGWETCKKIKSDPTSKDILVAMLTIKSKDEHKIKSLDEAHADWHISKPIKEDGLVQTVKWLLDMPLKRRSSRTASKNK